MDGQVAQRVYRGSPIGVDKMALVTWPVELQIYV